MERSLTLQQPRRLGREDVADAANRLFSTLCVMLIGRPEGDAAETQPLSSPRPPTAPGAQEAWLSYAVYSGALSLRHYKSFRRLP